MDVEVAPCPEEAEARREAKRKRREAREKEKLRQLQENGMPVDNAAEGEAGKAKEGTSSADSIEGKRDSEERSSAEGAAPGVPKEAAKAEGDVKGSTKEASQTKDPAPGATTNTTSTNTTSTRKSRRRSHARPTTDPVKIYSQCCQLRETHVVPFIKEQLMKAGGAAVLQELDLTGHQFTIADCVAFSDFLALVPIKQLVLEDCDLTDEMVRVILSALSAVKTPLPEGVDPVRPGNEKHHERGVVEKLSFKNNGRIGAEGWQYISCFIHMSHSLRAIDLSKITLPRPAHGLLHSLTQVASGKGGSPRPGSPAHTRDKASDPTSSTFAKALGDRLVGHGLEELVMGHCCLNPDQLAVIMEGVMKGGTKRLGLEGNAITDDGLAIIGQWMKGKNGMGPCETLDLSHNSIVVSFSFSTTPECGPVDKW